MKKWKSRALYEYGIPSRNPLEHQWRERYVGTPNDRHLRLDDEPRAPPVVSKIESRLRAVPEFYPKDNLNTFIYEQNEDDQIFLNALIRYKLKNEARDPISYNSALDWPNIKLALITRFDDKREEDLIVQDLRKTVQNFNESYTAFYDRVKNKFTILMQAISLRYQQQQNWFRTKKDKTVVEKTQNDTGVLDIEYRGKHKQTKTKRYMTISETYQTI